MSPRRPLIYHFTHVIWNTLTRFGWNKRSIQKEFAWKEYETRYTNSHNVFSHWQQMPLTDSLVYIHSGFSKIAVWSLVKPWFYIMWYHICYNTMKAEKTRNFKLTKYTPSLALMGEWSDFFCEIGVSHSNMLTTFSNEIEFINGTYLESCNALYLITSAKEIKYLATARYGMS